MRIYDSVNTLASLTIMLVGVDFMYPKVANISIGFFPVYKIAVDSDIKKSPYFILAVISVLYKISIIGSAPYQVLLIQHKIQTGMSHFLTI